MDEILKINRALIESSVADLKKNAPDIEAKLFEEAKELLMRFNIQGGNFVPDETTPQLIASINRIVREALIESGYDSAVDDFILNFDELGDNVGVIHKEASNLNIGKRIINSQKRLAVENVLFSMKSANMDFRYVQPVRDLLYKAVSLSRPVTATERELRTLIKGASGDKGIIERWVGQVARDSINQYQGAIHTEVKNRYELDEILYVGSLVEDSRPQCVRWVGQGTIKIEDLASELRWARNNGTGFIAGTDVNNFLINRGGYNCRHEAIPV